MVNDGSREWHKLSRKALVPLWKVILQAVKVKSESFDSVIINSVPDTVAAGI